MLAGMRVRRGVRPRDSGTRPEIVTRSRCLHRGHVDPGAVPHQRITITQDPVDQVSYYRVELPSHDVILAEGLPAESYLDTGNRADFKNGPVRRARAINVILRTGRSPSPTQSHTT